MCPHACLRGQATFHSKILPRAMDTWNPFEDFGGNGMTMTWAHTEAVYHSFLIS